MNFIWIDWVIVVAFVAATTGVALMTRRLISDYDSFLLAGRSLRLFLSMATMGATELGLVTLMYFSQQGYSSGFSAFSIGVISLLGFFFVGKTGFIIKGLRRLQCHTVAEFFGIRYNRGTQVIAAIITFAAGLMNMGLFLMLGAKFLLYMVGLPPHMLPYLMAGLLLLVLLYTVVGGMVSVVLTDYLQFIILFTSVVLTTWFAVTHVGYDTAVSLVEKEYGRGGFDPFANEDLGWMFIVWISLTAMFSGMWPPALSRAPSTVDSETSRKLYGFVGLSFLGRALMPMLWGICAFAYFQMPDAVSMPVENGSPDTAAAMPVYLSQVLPAGVRGIVVAAALAAMMSTFDSYLLCWSSILVNDIVLPLKQEMTESSKIKLTRIAVVGCGLFVLLWGYLYEPPETFFRFMAITGTMYSGSVLLTTAMGLYWKKANSAGTAASLIVAGLLPLTAIFLRGSTLIPEQLQWMVRDRVVGISTYALSLLCIVVVSLLTQKSVPPKAFTYKEDA
ncbi:MAG: sodium:solute symporter family protein [Candidatus Latescibacterota bacterium]|nr:sodium:solute symporter family protein [Candidatus Latescibacterota bacterium]